jgi:hypothetical protein
VLFSSEFIVENINSLVIPGIIFADLTYYFHQGKLQNFTWTYPDYLDEQKKEFFCWGRSFLLQSKALDA